MFRECLGCGGIGIYAIKRLRKSAFGLDTQGGVV